jgi:tRNA A-37 threonylcarbamoyl transferase component Bud32
MVFTVGDAYNLLVGFTLFILALTLFAAGRRRPEGLTLTVYLLLVALNFIGGVLAFQTGDAGWQLLSWFVLALDPFFLLLFVTLYPYRRRTSTIRVLLFLVGVAAVIAASLVLFVPDQAIPHGSATAFELPGSILIEAELGVAYFAAWILAIRSAAKARTPLLARRAAWMAAAVGITTVPRLGLIPEDGFLVASALLGHAKTRSMYLFGQVVNVFQLSILAALVFAAGWWAGRAGNRSTTSEVRRALKLVAAVVGLILAGRYVFVVLGIFGGPNLIGTVTYGLRWFAFAGMLVYGLLAYEVVEFRQSVRRIVPVVAALVGGAGMSLMTGAYLSTQGVPSKQTLLLSFALGIATVVPAAALCRAGLRRWAPAGAEGERATRALELYRAALESAWARGPPSAEVRRRLERERRAFGLSEEEGRTLEHVVATATASPTPSLRSGDEPVAGIIVESLLGEGAHGRVFAARHPSGDAIVVKEYLVDRLGTAGARQKVLTELRSLEGFQHPNVVRLRRVHVVPGRYLLEFDRLDAEPLSDLLRRGPLGPERVRAIVVDLLAGLKALHARGVVHRDIKPSNILIRSDGRALLTDFGVAAAEGDAEAVRGTIAALSRHGEFAGTLEYMAPEQVRGQAVGPPADLYALGVVAYECLTGRPALDLRGRAFFDAMEMVAHPHIDLKPVPSAWRAWLARALNPSPRGRYTSAEKMLQGLGKRPASAR